MNLGVFDMKNAFFKIHSFITNTYVQTFIAGSLFSSLIEKPSWLTFGLMMCSIFVLVSDYREKKSDVVYFIRKKDFSEIDMPGSNVRTRPLTENWVKLK